MFDMGESLTQQIYRGKDYSTNDWVYGNLLVRRRRCYIVTADALDFMVVNHGKATMKVTEVDPETVGIYTLHNDWYDIKVFTGDIIETVSEPGGVYSTENRMLVLYNRHAGIYYADGLFMVAPYEFRYCRVVGNVYDDPELFESVNLDESYIEEEIYIPESERLWQLAMDAYDGNDDQVYIDPSTYRRDGVVARECPPDQVLSEDNEEEENL